MEGTGWNLIFLETSVACLKLVLHGLHSQPYLPMGPSSAAPLVILLQAVLQQAVLGDKGNVVRSFMYQGSSFASYY